MRAVDLIVKKRDGAELAPEEIERFSGEVKRLSAEVLHTSQGITLAPTARLVVFGDSDFASNTYLSTLGNRDLFANAVNWLAEDESLISIRAKPPSDRGLYMTTSEQILGLVTSVVLLPRGALRPGSIVRLLGAAA